MAEDLDVAAEVADQARLLQQLRRDLGAGVEARQVADVQRSRRYVRNGPIGIASFEVEPRCLPIRMYAGIWPPSKPARILCEPARDFWPLIPRPE